MSTIRVGATLAVIGCAALSPSAAWADPQLSAVVSASVGGITGIVTSAAGAPLARATVTAVKADGSSVRSTVAGSDGVFSFADVPPGDWTLLIDDDGYPAQTPVRFQVIAGRTARHDLTINGQGRSGGGSTTVAVAPPAATKSLPTVPLALQAPEPAPEVDTQTPFAVGDLGWMNGTPREKAPIFDTNFFTPEIRLDMNYLYSSNHPIDHTIVGSTEEFRSGEFQIEQVSFGGDFHWKNVKARFLSMFGMFATTTPRNDASSAVGQWDLSNAYRYFSEANAGYHWDINHGLNVDLGVFVSYIGLFSYYNYDNWTYQPSFVSSNTPWFFNGMRVQWWPTQTLKIEPWLINGWQSYAKFNGKPGFGGQILWIPNENLKLVFNSYSIGQDNLPCQANKSAGAGTVDTLCQPQNGGNPSATAGSYVGAGGPIDYSKVRRIHEDDSLLVKYFDAKGTGGAGISKMAFSWTVDIGCEYGGGITCSNGPNKANFFGSMFYNRVWFNNDLYAITIGGGFMNNPGRYLALTPPINGATAASGTPYFTQQPGQKLYQWDTQLNLQYMPADWITWWTEATFRHSSVPYWSGPGGVTPPGGNTGSPGSCAGGGTDATTGQCSTGDWAPDLRTREVVMGAGVLVKF